MKSSEIRENFLKFFESKEHRIIPSSSLIPENDPSVLLTTAGMQQFKPYYSGAADPLKDNHLSLGHPLGSKNVASIQKSFRTSDIDEVGDGTHLTFFEMLGNFSFGGYGKKQAIEYAYEFITKIMGLQVDYVSIFAGEGELPRDTESERIWKDVDSQIEIRAFGRSDNFWGPTGDQGPCGPTTEIYVNGVEIWNIVFNEFYQTPDGRLAKLDILGVDTGMGLERLAQVAQKVPTIYETDLFAPIVAEIPKVLSERDQRIIADHIRAIVFLISDGVKPSNKEAGYVLRRLLRRVLLYEGVDFSKLIKIVIDNYKLAYPELNLELVMAEFDNESKKFSTVLGQLEKSLPKLAESYESMLESGARVRGEEYDIGKLIFDFYQTHGFPPEATIKKFKAYFSSKYGYEPEIDEEQVKRSLEKELQKHQTLSRTASAGAFKGGLVDHEPQTIKHHTAHHLLLAALRQVLGNHVFQRGSNVSSERLRIDFSHPEKVTPEQLKQVEGIVNNAIQEDLPVERAEMPKTEAERLGALAEFGAKYGDTVSVYTIYNKDGSVFSREFCGGPHVEHTGEIGKFKIIKEEASSAGVRRIKAKAE